MDDKIIGEGKLNEGVIRERKRELNELAVEPEISLNAEVFLDSVRITGVQVNYYHI